MVKVSRVRAHKPQLNSLLMWPQEDYVITEDDVSAPLRWLAPELVGERHGGVITMEQTKPGNVWYVRLGHPVAAFFGGELISWPRLHFKCGHWKGSNH